MTDFRDPSSYVDRRGYNELFLAASVPLPTFDAGTAADVLEFGTDIVGASSRWLHYHHFSVAMSRSRKFAHVSAANLDLDTAESVERPSSWHDDSRLDSEQQIGEKVGLYGDKPFNFDRGHLTRREDVNWGANLEEIEAANLDTHVFTNCTPQHEDFNQDSWSWRAVEEHIARQVAAEYRRVTVFTGPVFGSEDPEFAGIAVPMRYWKIIVVRKSPENVRAAAFDFGQEHLFSRRFAHAEEVDWYERIELSQVTVREIERRCGLDFGELRNADVRNRRLVVDEEVRPLPIRGLHDIVVGDS